TLTVNPCIDKSSSIENVVAERKLRCEKPKYEPGGGGINVCRAIHKLGGTSTALYLAGGPAGRMLDMLLEHESITYERQTIEGLTRQNLIVYERATQQQYRFGMPGPHVREEEWKQCLKHISEMNPTPKYVVASGSLPPGLPDDFYGKVAQLTRDMNARLILDTTGAPLRLAVEEGVYMIKPNLRELKALAAKAIDEESHQVALARQIIQKGQSETVVVSLGAAGALLVWRDGCERLRAPTVPISSKVGAGDSMVGGMVLALDRGDSLLSAVRFGVAAGAAAVMTGGTELCRRDDTERLYAGMTSD
ncbi:MAG: 1-phosphofructokinase family hexose kinase, partial [Desulfatiglandaceae bacterium]